MTEEIRATGEIREELDGVRDALYTVRATIAEARDRYERGIVVERRLVNREADLILELAAAHVRLDAETAR